MKGLIVWAIFVGLSLSAGLSQSAPPSNPGPVQAELLRHLDVRKLKVGDTLFARMTLDWNGPDCSLRNGAILEATVEAAELRSGHRESKLALSFNRAQCNGAEMQPMKLILAAVALPPEDWRVAPNPEFRVPMNFVQVNGQMGAGFGGMTISNLFAPTMDLIGILHKFPMSPKIKPGDVIGIRGLKLALGTGPNQSSVLTTRGRHVSLDAYTQFLLVPASMVLGSGNSALASSYPASVDTPMAALPRPSPPAPANDLETCAPPGCAVDLPVSPKDLAAADAWTIPIQPLGYAPRSHKIREDFEDEEALVWLGPRQLLFAFNPHPLIHRDNSSGAGNPRRIIRAVVLNVETHSIDRAVDWEVADANRYLWALDGGRILVHVGNELRVYRAGLELERSFPLAGPLEFVRISPNGELLAVATTRERHSAELHSKLRQDLGKEPEEDVDVAVLDKAFHLVAQASASSGVQAPTLLNEGHVRLFSQPDMKFRLALNTWDHKTISLARFSSRCVPELSSVPPDLLFLLSCDIATGATTYRILNAEGKLLLSGEAGPRDVGHAAVGNEPRARFAIKVVRAIRELSPGIEFTTEDLESQEVRVYRASDGKRLLAVRVQTPVASHDSYAFSPDGDQLAVLSESQIRFFPVPAE